MALQINSVKRFYPVFTLVFLLLSLVGAIALVKTTQNLQNRAASGDGTPVRVSDGCPSHITFSANNRCIISTTPDGAVGAEFWIDVYSCPGEHGFGSGCQKNFEGPFYSSPSSRPICFKDNFCGLQQIDLGPDALVRAGHTEGNWCHISVDDNNCSTPTSAPPTPGSPSQPPPSNPPSCVAISSYAEPANPAPGAPVTFIFTSNRSYNNVTFDSRGGANNCQLTGASCENNPKDGNRCWWRWACTSANPGSYTGVFSNDANCPVNINYNVAEGCVEIKSYAEPPNPAPGTPVTFTFTSNRSYNNVTFDARGGANNCQLTNASCENNPKDSSRCWWRWACTSANSGSYTGVFSNDANCPVNINYNVTLISSPTPQPSTTPSPTLTPTSTLTPSSSPTPTPQFSCNGLTLNGQSSDATIILGASISLDANVSHHGIISSAKVDSVGKRVVEGTQIQRLAEGSHPTASFQPTEAGIYVIEVNAYDSSSCNLLCTAGSIVYRNKIGPNRCVTDINDWETTGSSCTSTGCIHWITVNPPQDVVCAFIKLYDESGTQITDLSTIRIGTNIQIATKEAGSAAATKARFRVTIDGTAGNWQETTTKNSNNEFYISYTITQTGSYEIEAQVYNDAVGWR